MGGQESHLKGKKPDEKCGVIASIDFGTKCTGYVFMFRNKNRSSEVYQPQQSHMKESTLGVCYAEKDSTGTFELVAFGNEAMGELMKLEKHEDDDYFFFRLFKTDIVAKDKSLFVKDYKKIEVDAEVVFSKVYEFVQSKTVEHLKKIVKNAKRTSADDIVWLIAIPATWGRQYRDFIRKAAEKSYNNIVIVLESEAASIYVRNKPVSFQEENRVPFKTGKCYILVDIGAGTSDICTHKVLANGNVIEVCSSAGINEGSERKNKDFFNKFNELFTKEVMDTLRLDTMRFYKFEKEFEDHKHKFKSVDKEFVFLLDETLLTLFENKTHRKFNISSTYNDELEF